MITPELPWAMPSRSAMAASPRKVMAYFHTFPIYPIRSGATGYGGWLQPNYDSKQYYGRGGRWRQRPYPFIEGTLTNEQRVAYAKDDIATAAQIGIDSFTFNILQGALPGGSERWRWTEHIMPYYDAAAQYSQENSPGFSICPNPSMLSWAGGGVTPTQGADGLQPLLAHPAAFKINGRPVVVFYNVDDRPAQWYRDFYNRLKNTHGINAALIPSHQSSTPTGGGNMNNYLSLFRDGIFTGLHPWNSPGYTATLSSYYSTWRTWCKANNVPFMCSAGPTWENDRMDVDPPKEREGRGLTILANSWQSAINNGDPMMQIVSWSDHLESHNIRPSTGYQCVPYDVTGYYLAWYKTGVPPVIERDAVFYAHRMHLSSAPYDKTKQTMAAVSISGVLNKVITHTFVKAGTSTITATIGGKSTSVTVSGPGMFTHEWPFAAGDTPKFKVTRNGVDVVPQFASAFPTRSAIVWQDLLYRMGSSTRPPIPGVQSDLPQDRV